MAERGRKIQAHSGSDCGQTVEVVVAVCMRDGAGKVWIKRKKRCLESENKMYSEVVMQK